ncbi:restriction endonuclease subunit S [Kiloniella sp. b19]|uniref:restriction endonuclease subunit S n=1 Tax=Kiloniella sp. GXU_MW_B19 TaxID=3141326 RepID=UPI0031DBE90C
MSSVKISDISSFVTSGSRGWASYYSNSGALFLRMTNLPKNGIKLLLNDNKYVQLPDKSNEGKRTALQYGDILISITAELGKIGFVEQLPDSEAYVNQHVCLVRPIQEKVHPKFLAYYLSSQPQRNLLNRLNDSGAKSGLNLSTIAKFPVILPDKATQEFIVDALEQWDTAIEKTETLINAKERQFGWLVTRLINKSGHKKKQLSDFISEVSVRNRGNEIDRVLSVTNRSGFVLPEDQFERRVASANVSNYKIVQQGQYAYNPSRINVGSIARLDDWDNGILSPMYTVFKLDQKIVNSDYFLHWLSSSEAKQRIKKSAQGSVRETVSFGDLGAIPICLPELSVQQNIANTLNTAQQEITLLKKLADQYRTQKRGLMQKLLSGEWHIKNKEAA